MMAVVTSLVFGVLLGQQTPDKSNVSSRLQAKDPHLNRICERLLAEENLDCIVSDSVLLIVVYQVQLMSDGLPEFTDAVKLQTIDPAQEYAERTLRNRNPRAAYIVPAIAPEKGFRYQFDRYRLRVVGTSSKTEHVWKLYENFISSLEK